MAVPGQPIHTIPAVVNDNQPLVDDEAPTYEYLGCHAQSKIHIIQEQAFESISYIPVHEQLGVLPGEIGTAIKYDYLSNMPKFSPNGKFMMVFPDGNNAMNEQRTFLFYKNNIEVAKMGNGRFLEVGYELNQPDLVVLDAYWLNDQTVLDKAISEAKNEGEPAENDYFYIKISLP